MNKPIKQPARTPPRLLTVARTEQITPKMQRITLKGEALQGFPTDRNGAHIKIFLPREGQHKPHLPKLGPNGPEWPPQDQRPITRTYSVRRYHPEAQELDIDFVLHGQHSPASGWAASARPGDHIGIAGPGGPDPLLAPADWHIIAGDATALPAISAILEDLPKTAKGHVFIEVASHAEMQLLHTKADLQINWLNRNGEAAGRSRRLLRAVENLTPPANARSLSAWVAGENASVIAVRDYLRQGYGLTKKALYAVPYWRDGQDEETYHQERHRVMDEVY